MTNKNYKEITVLSEFEHIRLRAGMYIGDTYDPTHLFSEVYDNSVDEAIAGHCNHIKIDISDTEFTVSDNGRGIPHNYNKEYDKYDIELIATKLHSGGKFNKSNYDVSIGLNGVGLVAVNALSDTLEISSYRADDYTNHKVVFKDGISRSGVIMDKLVNSSDTKYSRGTTVRCVPSKKYFTTTKIDIQKIKLRLRLACTFIEGLSVSLNGTTIKPYSDEELFNDLDTPLFKVSFTTPKKEGIQAYFGYNQRAVKKITDRGSVNLLSVDNGAHISLLEKAIKEAWRSVVDDKTLDYLVDEDYLCGMRSFIFIKLAEPKYTSQTKERLAGSYSRDYKELYDELVVHITKILKDKNNRKTVDGLINKFKDYRQSINKLSNSKYIDEVISLNTESIGKANRNLLSLDSKLVDCLSESREGTELTVCEGDSAGGGLIGYRNKEKHAVLPLRGKVLNVIGKDIKDILSNLEIRSLINSLGTSCLSREDTSRLRYEKIIIVCDADIDGMNIQALLIGALCHLTPNLVKDGHLYIAHPPLYGRYDKSGKFIPVWSDSNPDNDTTLYRFKGLGSMDPKDLAEVVFSKNRKLSQVEVNSDKQLQEVLSIVGNTSFRTEMLVKSGIVKV